MYSFNNDYSEGAHERIMNAIMATNMEQTPGYGKDKYSEAAKSKIKEFLKREDVDIHFLVGGTQTNLTFISGVLRPFESVISAESGHVLVHETGAIEATGHKVISVPSEDGKLKAEDIKKVVEYHTDEHMVHPKLVYISNPTEIGTIYSKRELEALREICDENNLYLYMDGARLASALTSVENDILMADIARLTDAFYIGGTKCGAFMGEALVIVNDAMKENFRYVIKQRGAMFAKGRIIGIQFHELFDGNLYFRLGDHANRMAEILREGIREAGYKFMIETSTNQIFPIFPNDIVKELEKEYDFLVWQKIDEENTAIRLVTSWATSDERIEEFILKLKSLKVK